MHFSSVFIECLGINFRHLTEGKTVFVNVRDDSFDMVYFKDSKLVFYNLFRFRTKEDFIYFLLASVEQLGLNPETAEVVLSGMIEKDSGIFDMISRYIRSAGFIRRNDSLGYSHVLEEVSRHQYYVLFNAVLCG